MAPINSKTASSQFAEQGLFLSYIDYYSYTKTLIKL